MPRFFVNAPLTPGQFRLPEKVLAHLAALRLETGAVVTLFNGDGGEYRGALTWLGRRDACVEVGARQAVSRESSLSIHLIQSLIAPDKFDWIVQKAAELGVRRLSAVQSAFSPTRLSSERLEKKIQRWRDIAVSASEQCGRNTLMQVDNISLSDVFAAHAPKTETLKIVAGFENAQPLKTLFRQPERAITALIGPEGGLSAQESALAHAAGFVAVSLGPRILRAETAAIGLVATLENALG